MKTGTEAYQVARQRLQTEPIYFVRFFDVPEYGKEAETAFDVDFSSGPVEGATTPKIECIEKVTGSAAQVFPEQGRSSIGNYQIKMVDVGGQILRYLSFETPGAQIRPGQRAQLFMGYRDIPESDYMSTVKMEVVDRRLDTLIEPAFTVELADIQRATRREVFLSATIKAPYKLGPEHPLVIALWVLTSTGTGGNGSYDVLAEENGLGIPQSFIDVASFEDAINATPSDLYCFMITGPEVAKAWLETEIYKTINAYPIVDQIGRIKVKLYKRLVA